MKKNLFWSAWDLRAIVPSGSFTGSVGSGVLFSCNLLTLEFVNVWSSSDLKFGVITIDEDSMDSAMIYFQVTSGPGPLEAPRTFLNIFESSQINNKHQKQIFGALITVAAKITFYFKNTHLFNNYLLLKL